MNEGPREPDKKSEDPEEVAQTTLDYLLSEPDNAFLSEVPQNHERIENAGSSAEALEIAQGLILQRLERTYKFSPLAEVEESEVEPQNFEVVHEFVDSVKTENKLVGEGGYAIVVIAEDDMLEGMPPGICYKITKVDKITPDLNSLTKEAKMQQVAINLAKENPESIIGVPKPYYVSEIGLDKIFAMEKLPAVSLRELQSGKGEVPGWLDIDKFCDELKSFVEYLNENGLYHRDLHEGNVMIRQSDEPPADGKHGYVIDFGFSDQIKQNLEDPYRKEVGSRVFTYMKDYVIIEKAREILTSLK